MSTIANCIFELLNRDMVSHGLLLQTVEQEGNPRLDWIGVVAELLSIGVEIGEAKLTTPDYVEFVAWNGTLEERLKRAKARVEGLAAPDREFAYWLALRKNVDRFEGAGVQREEDGTRLE
jgi:hypothetical protein